MATENAARSEPFVPLHSVGSLDELFLLSSERPVVLFKHSLTCPISSAAYQQMQRLTREVWLIVIQQSPDTSAEIGRRTGVRHESPQVIIIRNGTAVWSATHWSITADAVERAVEENE